MKIRERFNKFSFFHKSLIITLLISIIPVTALSIMTYSIGVREIRQEVGRTQQLQYAQAAERLDAQLNRLKLTVNQWAYHPFLMELNKQYTVGRDVRFTLDLFNQLIVMKNADPLIEKVSLLLQQESLLLIEGENGIRTIDDDQLERRYQSLLEHQRSIFWGTNPELAANQEEEKRKIFPLALIQKIPVTMEPVFGALIVELNKNELRSMLKVLSPPEQGTAFILDEGAAYLVTNDEQTEAADNGLNDELRQTVLQTGQRSGTFSFSSGSDNYVVTYDHLDNTDWLYVSAAPLSHLLNPVKHLLKIPLFSILLGLLFALVLSWLGSKQLYRPLQQLTRVFGYEYSKDQQRRGEFHFIESRWHYLIGERSHLQAKLQQATPALREGFLLQLVQGHLDSLSEQRIREQLIQYDIHTQDQQFSMLLIQLYGFTHYYANLAKGDEQLISFAAANIIDEILKQQALKAFVINFQDLTIGVLLLSPADQSGENIKSGLFELAHAVISPLQLYLKLQVAVSLSPIATVLKQIPSALEDARHAISHRDIAADNAVIDAEDIVLRGDHSTPYPFIAEKGLIQLIQIGAEEQALEQADAFMAALQSHSTKEFAIQQGMLQLLGNVQFAMLQIGCNLQQMHRGVNLFDQLLHIREPAGMLSWFKSMIITPTIREMQSIKDLKSKQIIDKVLVMLQENYMHDISLEMCADRFGTYAQKLSASFRQIIGINFIDYLTRLRLDKSKELLISTQMKINDIAEQVGYQPTYYNRIFKKHEGMTPGQFREKHTDGA
ncbi:AraC family transcriptional regulator [Paenibacillus sp. GCM10012307]|uniref:AraC family transcriptional regulator n=2 Tax=Paenibacillus TaxID=44249 RepID=A0A934JB19_9BACL|nr:AraC family transcriptional regulator [Paenibacillus roseus]MBJ6363891.1 AraC family transcriptional regulator [Paenibacillus roseus]